MVMGKAFWTTVELAAKANVTARFVRQEIADGRLKAEHVGRDWAITDDEARRWLSHETGRKRKAE
jgi:excisionase family DNA binding protein